MRELYKRGGGNNSGENVTSSDSLIDFEETIMENINTVNQNIIHLNSKINDLNNGYSTLQDRLNNYSDPNSTDGSIYDTFRSVNAEELGYEVDNYGNIIFNKPVTFNNPVTFNHAGFFNQPVAFNKTVRINDKTKHALRVDGEISVGADDNFRACIKIDGDNIVFGRFDLENYGYVLTKYGFHEINVKDYLFINIGSENYMFLGDQRVEIKRKLEIRNKDNNDDIVGVWENDGSIKALNVSARKDVDAQKSIYAERFQIQNSNSYWNNWDFQLGSGEIMMNIGSHHKYCVQNKPYVKIGTKNLVHYHQGNSNRLLLYNNVRDCNDRAWVKYGW